MKQEHALQRMPDDDLLRGLVAALGESRRCEADLVAHIGEVDRRRLYAREASTSMFAYCTDVLCLSEAEAYLRIAAARAAREHPVLLEMLADGRLKLDRPLGYRTTYHDPCHLGRFNKEFDSPRALIEAVGCELVDMARSRDNSFCCGAGGGRIWNDDTGVKERPSENRIKEALGLADASIFVVACPKDTVMYTAAVQALGVESRIAVRDVLDLVELDTGQAAQRESGQPAAA